MITDPHEEIDDDVTERTESISAVKIGGKFDIVLDVKKVNSNKSVKERER